MAVGVDSTKARILEAAGSIFAAKGFEAATVREICQIAGANLAAVNYHFGDKQRLYIETIQHAHRSRAQEIPLPVWDESTPAEVKLRGFVGVLLERMLGEDQAPWHAQLMLREIARPNLACEELVRDYIRPQFEALKGILRELLPPDASEERLALTAFSVVGQCLFYRVARPVVSMLLGGDQSARLTTELLADHIAGLMLAAIRSAEGRAMIWVALKMLTGNRGKYLGIILGVAFAALLIAQQSSIFCGLMRLTTSQIKDIQGADIWVMDRNVQFIDDIKPLSENDLYRVRGVPGVQWAVRLYKGLSRAKLANGNFQQTILIGLDDATLVGAPQEVVLGNLADLRRPDAVIIDEDGYRQLWPDEPFELGRTFEMNDRLATIVGVCKARRTFQTFPVVYTRYSQATLFVPRERKVLSFILAQPEPSISSEQVCLRINTQTGLKAETREQFSETTIWYYMKKTGIPINFGITVVLGFIVGAAIAGQTFYLFTIENLKQFGALKAMGASNGTLVLMILLQAILVAFIGYGLGVGAAALFGTLTKSLAKLAFFMPWEVLVGTGVAVVVMAVSAALLSIRKVMVLEPAIVFQG